MRSSDVVRFKDGSFYVIGTSETLGSRISELFNVIRQVSDLIYTLRGYSLPTFKDEVADFLREKTLTSKKIIFLKE